MKESKLPYSTFLIIEWQDATSNDGWTSPDADVDVEHIVSAGWLIKETDVYITIAGSIYRNSPSTIGSTMTIPKGMIVSRKEVKISNARSKLQRKISKSSTNISEVLEQNISEQNNRTSKN